MEALENDTLVYSLYEADENSTTDIESCPGVFDLEGFTFPVNATDLEDTLAPFYANSHHYQHVPPWVFIILLTIGFSGNLVNVFVYSRPFMRTPINYILCSLEFVNIFLFATFIPDLVRYYNPKSTLNLGLVLVDIITPVVETAVVGCSNWLTVAVGVWRYLAISWPLYVDKWCNKMKTKLTIAGIVVACVAITAPGAFTRSFEYVQFNVTYQSEIDDDYAEIRRFYLTRPSTYVCDNPNLEMVTDGLILLTTSVPCFSLAIVTFLLLQGLWKAKRARNKMLNSGPSTVSQPNGMIPFNKKVVSDQMKEKRITIILICLVVLFFLAYLPDSLLNVLLLANVKPPQNAELWSDTVFYHAIRTRILILVCNCLTFFIYYFMSERYREALFRSFRPGQFKKELSKMSNGTVTSSSKGQSVRDISLVPLPNDGPV